MLSRRGRGTSFPRIRAPKQFARHTFARRMDDDEQCVKVFNSSVENFVEKEGRQTEIPRQC
jgi:hypothetical protein